MSRLLLAISIAIFAYAPAFAQHKECEYGFRGAADSLVADLTSAKTCSDAADRLHECAWGSSADREFAGIVIKKCEVSFKGKLTSAAKRHYESELDLCAYEQSRQEGTLFISEAALCQVDIAVGFAANPSAPVPPPARASFPCEKTHSPLERIICSDPNLGRADIVLGRAYSNFLSSLTAADKPSLIADEKKWLAALTKKCSMVPGANSLKTRACLINEFELRFTALDACGHEASGAPTSTSCLTHP